MTKSLLLLPLSLALAGCDPAPPAEQGRGAATTGAYERPAIEQSPLRDAVVPVRVGELGPAFAACTGRGRGRERLVPAEGLPVRASPYEQAEETGRLAGTREFFICTRSHDQRWFGIVFDAGEEGLASCGLGARIASVREYEGPCASGWVASALVRQVSGINADSVAEPKSTG